MTGRPAARGPALAVGWQVLASCRGVDPELFFHPEGERGAARERRAARAAAVCQDCPVIVPCLQHALTYPEPYGTWGGYTEEDRRHHLARPRRGGSRWSAGS
ncbi:WhiB family transcriptional regulator [Ornithinimicrobium cerasi]|uniref:WhiB family transcriptional regulator n=1 Tax=Ornithinimicrobium cerasi TaxID=2248773 RepID=UPI000EFEC4FD|nr:WhiB family transcriptional regulator [Ornithinimicrobium cerasi]